MFVHNNHSVLRVIGVLLLSAFISLPAMGHQVESTQPVSVNTTPVMATGTVSELTVTNPMTGATLHYFGLQLDQGTAYALAGTGLDQLTHGARITATGDLAGNILNVAFFSVVDPAQTSTRKTTLGQKQKTITGTLAVYHKDFFDRGRGEYGLAVRDAVGATTALNVAAIPDSLQIGMLINVDGTPAVDGASLDTSNITILAPAPAALTDVAAAPKTNTVLVIPIRFSDSPANSFNGAAIDTEFQTRVAPYYQEVSYGQQLLNITVACTTTVLAGCAGKTDANGWLQSASATPAGCDYTTMSNLAIAAASAAGYDTSITSAKFVYVVLPGSSGCGWAGLAYVGYGLAYSANYNALWVYGHELGHNFGLWHAGSIGCGAQVLGGSCGVSEYGDPFDVMGNIRQMHFNTKQKSALNWIPSTSVKVHTSGTQTYQLSPLETGSQSTYAIKIPTSSTSRTYWVEFRQPIGFDSPLSSLPNLGAQIRVASPFEFASGSDDTEILDMTPGSGGGFDDAALLAGQQYVDSVYGVTINVLSASPGPSGLLTVSVAMGGKTNTSTTLASSGSPSLASTSVTFTATVAGSAPTGSVAFTEGGSAIAGCSAVALPTGSVSTKSATCSTSSLSVGTHSIVATYSGDAGNNISTSATSSQVVSNKPASSTTLSSSGNPSMVGISVTFAATVAGTAPTGTVAFNDGGSAISGCSAVALPGGSANSKIATCSTSSLAAATHSIVATYSGDAGNNGSTSATWLEVVSNTTVSSTTLSSSGTPSIVGASVTFTATVAGAAPTATVAFTDGGTAISGCNAMALPAGSANSKIVTCITGSLTLGTHSIVATYVGDSNNNSSASSALTQIVNVASLVDHYYQAILNRAPDAAGKAYWESEIVRIQSLGVDVKEAYMVIAGVFFNSAEYLSRNTSDTQYVTDLYNTFFNRAPDPGGLAYWTSQIAAGVPRSIVMYGFLFSPEFNAFMTGLFGNTSSRAEVYAVVDFYRGILNRLPDTAGFNSWLTQFRAAQCAGAGSVYSAVDQISSSFIYSAEYLGRNRSNTDYVGDLYYAFLRRGGDLAGVNFWINQLTSGAETRERLRKDFINTPEFNGRVNAIIAQGCLS